MAEDWTYPIVGNIDLEDVFNTYINLLEIKPAHKDRDFVTLYQDIIIFTTKRIGDAKGTIKIDKATGENITAFLDLDNNRTDLHELVMVITAPEKPVPEISEEEANRKKIEERRNAVVEFRRLGDPPNNWPTTPRPPYKKPKPKQAEQSGDISPEIRNKQLNFSGATGDEITIIVAKDAAKVTAEKARKAAEKAAETLDFMEAEIAAKVAQDAANQAQNAADEAAAAAEATKTNAAKKKNAVIAAKAAADAAQLRRIDENKKRAVEQLKEEVDLGVQRRLRREFRR